jgi:hypothetical protein
LLLKFFSIAKGRIFVPPSLLLYLSLLSGKESFFFYSSLFFSLSFSSSFLSLSLSRKKTNKLAPLSKLGTEKKKEKSKDKNTINRASHRIVLIGFSTRSDSIAFVCSREIVFNVYACGLTLESEGRTSLFVLSLSLSLFFFERRKKKERESKEEERRQEREKSGGSFSSTLSFLLHWFEKKKKKKTQNEKNERRINGDVWIHSGWNKEQPRS